MATNIQKIHLRLKKAARRGFFDTETTVFRSYLGILKKEGFKVTILNQSEKHTGLVKVCISWKDAWKIVGSSTFKHYINDDEIDIMPNLAFELCVLTYRTLLSK